MTASIVHGLLPHAANEQHYAAARNTDSALVRFQEKEGAPSYFEKFLFYRGVGKFQLPLTSTFDGEVASLRNSGPHPIRSAILIDVEGDSIQAMRIDQIEPGHALPFHNLKSLSKEELASMVCDCLVKEGLYEKEAQAMVETWQGSWFTENGTRILYMVPSEITDKLLPLHISPKPQDTLRVLVARMELMSPAKERRMMELVSESKVARLEHYHQQNKRGRPLPYEVPENIRAFGRMTEPALARVAGLAKDKSIRIEAEALMATLLAQPNAKKNAAP